MYAMQPIGIIHSCFREKFGIPRQAGLVDAARATLELLPPYNCAAAVQGLETCSHIWLLFLLHQIPAGHWQPTVRPPRLGGNQRCGVFATRSPFRPNRIGLSAVRLERIVINNGVVLHLSGIDVLDATPVLDIKPYIPYADCIAEAQGGIAKHAPESRLIIEFTAEATAVCDAWQGEDLRELITQILAQNPRPVYHQNHAHTKKYALRLYDFDLHWEQCADRITVTAIRNLAPQNQCADQ